MEQAEDPKIGIIVDLDGVFFNNDEGERNYRQRIESNLLNRPTVVGLIQHQIDKTLGTQNPPASEQIITETSGQIIKAYWSAWDGVRERNNGTPNLFNTARNWCLLLEDMGLIPEEQFGSFKNGNDPFEDATRLGILQSDPLYKTYSEAKQQEIIKATGQAIARKRLAEEVLWAVYYPGDLSDVLYPEAAKTLEELGKRGNITLWTEGDPTEQASGKILHSPLWQVLRNQHPSMSRRWREESHNAVAQNVLSNHIISRDKRGEIGHMLEEFKRQGISKVIVLEDKARNLVDFQQEVARLGLQDKMEIMPVWVRQGRHNKTLPPGITLEEALQLYNAVDTIAEVPARVDQLLKSA